MSFAFLIAKILVALVGLFLLYAYLVRLDRLAIGRMWLGGSARWHALWPVIDAARSLVKPVFPGSPKRDRSSVCGAVLSLSMTLTALALIPLGSTLRLGGRVVPLWIANLDASLIYTLILSAIAPFGVLWSVWGSRSSYLRQQGRAVALRAWAYTLPGLLSVAGVVMLSGSLNLIEIVRAQRDGLPYAVYQPLGLMLLMFSLVWGSRRLPYRLPEGPDDLLSDFHLQHADGILALHHLVEYLNLIWISGLIATVYLAGWHGPWFPGPHWVVFKMVAVAVGLLWLRQRWLTQQRRERSEGSWRALVLLAIFNALLTAALLTWRR